MGLSEMKIEYNKLLKRYHDAEKYFSKNNIGFEEKMKFYPDFQEVLKALNHYLGEIKKYEKVSSEQILGGF